MQQSVLHDKIFDFVNRLHEHCWARRPQMKARSPEAIARRAAKRGLSVEEMKTLDRQAEKKHKREAEIEAKMRGKREAETDAESERSNTAHVPETTSMQLVVGIPWYKLDPDKRPNVGRKLKKDEKAGWVCMGVK